MNILIIGAGKLGSRHLQALSRLRISNVNLFVVDLNEKNLEIARARFMEMPLNNRISSINYYTEINDLNILDIQIAIIATTSDVRKMIIKQISQKFKIQYLILEKFLFQDTASYYEVKKILNDHKIKAWVNFPRRQWRFYKDLKLKLENKKLMHFSVIGSNWSLATSAIHFIDLISFLATKQEYAINNMGIAEILPAYSVITGSRDSKFIEFYGSIEGKFEDSITFSLNCSKSSAPFVISLVTNDSVINIYEEQTTALFQEIREGLICESSIKFEAPYQSELTNLLCEQLLSTGSCDLTTYEDSYQIHLTLLNSYLSFLNKHYNTVNLNCPVT